MKKQEIVPNYYAYDLRFNGKALTNQQRKHFFYCINKIYSENDKFIYRGDKKATFQFLYNVNGSHFDNEFYNSLFIMGTKANMLIGTDLIGVNEINIAVADDNVFRLIFRMLGNLLRREFPFGPVRMGIGRFRRDEKEITAFFREPENEQMFIDRINKIDLKQQIIVRDYYLALLHHINKSEYYSSSFLLSTTSNFSIAHKFAWNKEPDNSDNPIILFGWVPKNYEGVLSVPDTRILKRKVNMDMFNLPIYEKSFFYYQDEVTLKGGLLPHYLLGYLYYYRGRENFAINPALFSINNSWDGIELPIDQSTFHQRIQNTQFGRYFTFDNENNQYRQY